MNAIGKNPGANGLPGKPVDPGAPFRAGDETELEQLKKGLLRQALSQTTSPALWAPLRRAANEAAALAWLEPQPLLVFPALFEEKARLARKQFQKQEQVRVQSAGLLALQAAA